MSDVTGARRRLLVYQADAAEIKMILGLAARLELEALVAATPEEAAATIVSARPELALVDHSLPFVAVPLETRVVVTGPVTANAAMRNVKYHSLLFMPRPLLSSSLAYAMATLAGVEADATTGPARWIGIHALLRSTAARLKALGLAPEHQETLLESARRFCLDSCPASRANGEIEAADKERYEILHLLSRRGMVFCKEGSGCALMRYIGETLPESLRAFRPADHLKLAGPLADEDLGRLVERLGAACQERIIELFRLRHEHCLAKCPKAKAGVPGPGEGCLLNDYQGLMNGEKPMYCPDPECALDRFMLMLSDL